MATAATATVAETTTTTKRLRFPRRLGRFINLEGGLYGQLDLVAITATLLELQTGEDFVRFDRHQATNLRDTIDKFLAFEHHEHHHPPAVEETVEEEGAVVAVEMIEESREDFTRAKRTRPGRKITRKSERRA
jgi:hypothetical protein